MTLRVSEWLVAEKNAAGEHDALYCIETESKDGWRMPLMRNGEPLAFDTEEEAQAALEELQADA